MNTIRGLMKLGQSVWCDDLSRAMIDSGELRRLIEMGVVGVTSNPTIFMKAITSSRDYDRQIEDKAPGAATPEALYESLVVPDIADAADLLRPVYDATGGLDGFVSLEVSPKLAHDTEGTLAEARRLFAVLDRPNVLIKVPATEAGVPAIETLIGEGVNINVTLLFSVAVYERVMEAYIRGLDRLAGTGGDVSKISSVASFFVSRVDTLVDRLLEEKRSDGVNIEPLIGRAAVANAKLAYRRFEEVFAQDRFLRLQRLGARVQRPLWASTSTKNPRYSPTKYVDGLVAPNTVNTMPRPTIETVLAGDQPRVAIFDNVAEAADLMAQLERVGIQMRQLTETLRVEGVKLFAESFDELLASLAGKRRQLHPVG